jgi:pimeloyl-ACP methyl ester carboxylesterase
VVLDHVGHCPMIEAPDEFCYLVRDFATRAAQGAVEGREL